MIGLPIIQFSRLPERFELVLDAVCGERRLAKDTYGFEGWPAVLEVVFDDSNESVGDNDNVNLYMDCIFGFSLERFDLEMYYIHLKNSSTCT